MLSPGAFNAMLKTLEEPPSYVIFILATTEAHKIPITITSRCQRYDFRRISLETIYERLAELLKREGIEAEEKAVRYVAKAADGSMRDALSLLDQCIAFYLGETLTYEKVLEVLGAVDVEVFNSLMSHVAAGDTMAALKVIDEIVWQGRELSQFVADFTWYMRNLLLLKSSDNVNDQLDISAENLASMRETAQKVSNNQLMRYIRVFSEMSNQIRYATQKRVTLELAVIKLTTPQMEDNMDSLLDRIRVLEDKVERGLFTLNEAQLAALAAGSTGVSEAGNAADSQETPEEIHREEILKQELQPAEYEDMKAIMASIDEIKANPDYRLKIGEGTLSMLEKASINVGPDRKSLLLSFDNSQEGQMAYTRFSAEEPRTALQEVIAQLTGKQVPITCQAKASLEENDISNINLSKVKFDIKIEE
jgi:DNA polymerase-3 subunit gamma/tau